MKFALIASILPLTWAAITGNFSLANLLLGAGIGYVALWFIREQVERPRFFRRVRRILALAGLFLYELSLSALRVSALVLTPDLKNKIKPAIIAFPLTVTRDEEITLLANLITLTPGTLSVDVSPDRKYLYVHAVTVTSKQALIRDIAKGFEAKIIEVFQ